MAVRRFVLAPAAEIAPDLIHVPTRRSIADLLALLDRRPSLLALAGPASALKTEVFHRVVKALPATPLEVSPPLVAPPAHDPVEAPRCDDPRPYRTFVAAVESLDARHWSSAIPEDAWLVADFTPALDWGHHQGVPLPLIGEDRETELTRAHARQAYDRALTPTVSVVIDPTGAIHPTPWGPPHPVIRPESRSVDAIVSETLAACQATRSD
jgi:hypothetical protein